MPSYPTWFNQLINNQSIKTYNLQNVIHVVSGDRMPTSPPSSSSSLIKDIPPGGGNVTEDTLTSVSSLNSEVQDPTQDTTHDGQAGQENSPMSTLTGKPFVMCDEPDMTFSYT